MPKLQPLYIVRCLGLVRPAQTKRPQLCRQSRLLCDWWTTLPLKMTVNVPVHVHIAIYWSTCSIPPVSRTSTSVESWIFNVLRYKLRLVFSTSHAHCSVWYTTYYRIVIFNSVHKKKHCSINYCMTWQFLLWLMQEKMVELQNIICYSYKITFLYFY